MLPKFSVSDGKKKQQELQALSFGVGDSCGWCFERTVAVSDPV